jgi:hypothetical protein
MPPKEELDRADLVPVASITALEALLYYAGPLPKRDDLPRTALGALASAGPFLLLISAARYGFERRSAPMNNHIVCFAALVVTILVASPAAARIECRGNFQITKQGPISTPYCEERQIARVARSYGYAVTDEEVRNNPNTKVYLCQIIGGDNRLKGSCAGYANPRGFLW